jgi:endonuclease/exonuclease/phosphatase family metal-dependent hydrolase
MVGFEVVPIGVMKIEKLVSRHDGRKSALITKHKIKGKEFVVVNLHLGAYTSNKRRQRQLEMLVAKVGEGTKPTLLVGDFNFSSILGGRAWKKMLLENGFAPLGGRKVTHRIGKVVAHQLDYVFAKNCAVELFEVERKVKFSDHYPVMSEIGGGI